MRKNLIWILITQWCSVEHLNKENQMLLVTDTKTNQEYLKKNIIKIILQDLQIKPSIIDLNMMKISQLLLSDYVTHNDDIKLISVENCPYYNQHYLDGCSNGIEFEGIFDENIDLVSRNILINEFKKCFTSSNDIVGVIKNDQGENFLKVLPSYYKYDNLLKFLMKIDLSKNNVIIFNPNLYLSIIVGDSGPNIYIIQNKQFHIMNLQQNILEMIKSIKYIGTQQISSHKDIRETNKQIEINIYDKNRNLVHTINLYISIFRKNTEHGSTIILPDLTCFQEMIQTFQNDEIKTNEDTKESQDINRILLSQLLQTTTKHQEIFTLIIDIYKHEQISIINQDKMRAIINLNMYIIKTLIKMINTDYYIKINNINASRIDDFIY